jgi:coproporphyrinogen III oxidase-like Fe-S oxidoreductase
LEKIGQKEAPRDFTERPNLRQRAGETLMLALRRPEGLDFQAWQNRFGLTCNSVKKFQLETLAEKKLISWEPPNLRLTSKGMLLADAITSELMPEP